MPGLNCSMQIKCNGCLVLSDFFLFFEYTLFTKRLKKHMLLVMQWNSSLNHFNDSKFTIFEALLLNEHAWIYEYLRAGLLFLDYYFLAF